MNDKVIDTSDLSKFEKQLAEFKPPRRGKDAMPYVLFGSWALVSRPDGNGSYKQELEYRLRCLEFPVSSPSINKLAQYKGKGWVILDFYFPEKQNLTEKKDKTERGFKAILRSADVDPYSEARAYCQSQKNVTYNLDSNRKEISALKAELEKLKAKDDKPVRTSKTSLVTEASA